MSTLYILRGLDQSGKEFFYTGKAGDAWVSQNKTDAFSYSREGAIRKALTFNKLSMAVRFTAYFVVSD